MDSATLIHPIILALYPHKYNTGENLQNFKAKLDKAQIPEYNSAKDTKPMSKSSKQAKRRKRELQTV